LSLRKFLEKVRIELKQKEEIKEKIQENMRKATRLSKQAILHIHQARLREAKTLLKEASELFANLLKLTEGYPDLFFCGIVDDAFQEYAEAQVLLNLVEKEQFVGPGSLGVPPIDYVLGLADVIGELRRKALDMLRKGNVKMAEKCLEFMEQIYGELMAMDDAYMLVPGLRRKSDVARHVIEATRGDLTVESGRDRLERSIKRLEKVMTKKQK
jgi:translin